MSKLQSVITAAVLAGTSAAIADPATNATTSDRKIITDEVVKAIEPVITNAANAEPWYQSRVMLGSIATIISSGTGIAAMISGGVTDGTAYAPLVVAIIGAAFAIYGRIVAGQKPLGS